MCRPPEANSAGFDRNKPLAFTLGSGRVIKGLVSPLLPKNPLASMGAVTVKGKKVDGS